MRGSFRAGAAPPPPPVRTRLSGSVGPGRTISLRAANGTRLRTLPAGPVRLTVNDRSRAENFRLTGRSVNRATGVAFRGRVTWNLTLRQGRYVYRSDRTRALRGSFNVTAPS
jgi:hypothetical protein